MSALNTWDYPSPAMPPAVQERHWQQLQRDMQQRLFAVTQVSTMGRRARRRYIAQLEETQHEISVQLRELRRVTR